MRKHLKHNKQFRDMIWVGRLNGPMVSLLALFMLLAALFDVTADGMPLWGRLLAIVGCVVVLVLAIRWTHKSWKTKL
jgi:hypothetical protein